MALFYTYSGNVYGTASAGQTTFALTSSAGRNIPYLLPAHIHVSTSVNDQQTWVELARPADWNFDAQGTSVVLASPLPVATELRVQRITPTDEPFVDFQASSLLTAEQLNEGEEFSLYVDQELRDAVAIDLANALIYKGTVDLTADNAPLNPATGWTLYNTGAGVVIQGGTPGWDGIVGTTVEGGEQVIFNGAQWETAPVRPAGVVVVNGTAPITVNSTDPQRPVIGLPDATGATSGAMSAADKAKLDTISTDVLWTRTGTTLAPTTAGDVVEVSAGTAALPGLTPVGDPNTGIYSPGADQVAVATNSSERIRIGADGEIGLGGANYGTSGQLLTSAGSGAAPTWTTPPVVNTDKIEEGNTSAEVIDTGTDGRFVVTTDGAERFRVGNSGQVGLSGANYGTSGQVLTSNGSAAAATWQDAEEGVPTGGGTDKVFYENDQTVTASYTLTTNKNAMSAGPITINSGITVTVPSGSSWVIV